ncbi:unnamed protein product, partial [Parascedosporium putredinis]
RDPAARGGGLGLLGHVLGGPGTVGLAKGVATGDEGDGLLVVHGHATESGADIPGGGDGVRDAVGALGVHVDETHVAGVDVGVALLVLVAGQGAVGGDTLLATAVAVLVAEPRLLGAPVDGLVGLPNIGAAGGEAKSLAAHGLDGDVTGEEQEIRPRDLLAVLLLDGPEEAAGLVETGVVGPAVERGEALLAGATAAAAVGDTVGAGAVPGHADKETAVVAKVGGPPLLGVGHDGGEVLLELGIVYALEGLGVVEVLLVGVGHAGVLTEDVELELLGPPVKVPRAAAAEVGLLTGHWGGVILAEEDVCVCVGVGCDGSGSCVCVVLVVLDLMEDGERPVPSDLGRQRKWKRGKERRERREGGQGGRREEG